MELLTKHQYDEKFKENEVKTKALEVAMDIRKFEIDLYWKRAAYFWAFIAATFAGYFALLGSNVGNEHQDILFLLNCLGLSFSVSWFFVNRGSKFWQENWEKHIDMLEDEIVGPLYKTTVATNYKWLQLNAPYKYSVSKINQLLSLFTVVIWILIASRTIGTYFRIYEFFPGYNIFLFGIVTICFIIILHRCSQTMNNDKKVSFYVRGYPLDNNFEEKQKL